MEISCHFSKSFFYSRLFKVKSNYQYSNYCHIQGENKGKMGNKYHGFSAVYLIFVFSLLKYSLICDIFSMSIFVPEWGSTVCLPQIKHYPSWPGLFLLSYQTDFPGRSVSHSDYHSNIYVSPLFQRMGLQQKEMTTFLLYIFRRLFHLKRDALFPSIFKNFFAYFYFPEKYFFFFFLILLLEWQFPFMYYWLLVSYACQKEEMAF